MGAIRVNATINDGVLAKIDEYAEKNFLNRSAAISILCMNAIKQEEMMDASIKLSKMMDKDGNLNVSVVGASDEK